MTTEQHSERRERALRLRGRSIGMQAILPEGAMISFALKWAGDSEPAGSEAITGRIPIEIDVAIPIRDFRVRKLLALAPGAGDSHPVGQKAKICRSPRGSTTGLDRVRGDHEKLAVRLRGCSREGKWGLLRMRCRIQRSRMVRFEQSLSWRSVTAAIFERLARRATAIPKMAVLERVNVAPRQIRRIDRS